VLPLLAAAALAASLSFAGSRLGAWLAGPGDGRLYRIVLYSLAGWLEFHLLLGALGWAGIRWHPAVVAAAGAALVLLTSRLAPAPAALPRPGWHCGWGDGLALVALGLFTAAALTGWITISDFIFHWGLKGERFFLAQGIDYASLTRSWNWVMHPDYPTLLPELYAATALAAGRFDATAMMLWSAIAFALLLAAVREALVQAGSSRLVASAALATIACAVAAYGIAGAAAGGADWLVALALAAALPPLLRPAERRGAAQVGLAAAVAAAAKVEGVALAGALIGVYAVRLLLRWRQEARGTALARAAGALILPAAVVVLPWLAAVFGHHLFVEFNSGPLLVARVPRVLAVLGTQMRTPPWHGFTYVVALLPLLALDRRLRALAAVAALQLLFYLYVYLSVRIDPGPLIATSFSRLLLHLLPAVLAGAAIALERPGCDAPAEETNA
jgi:hypothetical protein